MNNQEPLLVIKNLAIKIKGRENNLLEIKDWSIASGEQTFILGPNGSGKSTFLRKLFDYSGDDENIILNRLDSSEEAVASIDGVNIIKDNDGVISKTYDQKLNNKYLFISQKETFVKGHSVYEALTTALKNNGLNEDEINNFLLDDRLNIKRILIKTFDLENGFYFSDNALVRFFKKPKIVDQEEGISNYDLIKFLKRKNINKCSGGQQKLINVLEGLIRAERFNIKLIAIDEPMNHLDHENKKYIADMMSNLVSDIFPFTFLVVSHCLIFDFISDEYDKKDVVCSQYVIKDSKFEKREHNEFHNCIYSYLKNQN